MSEPLNSSDEYFMNEALVEAKKAFTNNEVPVGAVLVHRGEIISRAHNQVEALQDATAHAEILCIKRAASYAQNWRLKGMVLYCTLEPCSMCAGAMLLSRIDTLVWGAFDIRHGANGSWVDILGKEHPIHCLNVRKGILQQECGALIKDFFQKRRLLNTLG
jgi:tRNA(adenine34) deaminase